MWIYVINNAKKFNIWINIVKELIFQKKYFSIIFVKDIFENKKLFFIIIQWILYLTHQIRQCIKTNFYIINVKITNELWL